MPALALPAALPDGLLPALAVDLAALSLLMLLLAWRRDGRASDGLTACVAFNVGLFAVAQVLASVELGVGAGFGLFAVLSIIRLRSDLFTQGQLAYVFSALALALVTGFPGVPLALAGTLAALVVTTVAVLELLRGRGAGTQTCTVVLDSVHAGTPALVAEVERRLGLSVVSVSVLDVDLVRETTRVEVRHTGAAQPAPVEAAPSLAPAPRDASLAER